MAGLIALLARIFIITVVIRRMRGDKRRPAKRAAESGPARPSATRTPGARRRAATEKSIDTGPVPSQRKGGPGPDTPLDLPAEDWKSTLTRTLTEIKHDRVTLVAAGMAYYFFLAIFPALIAVIGIMGLLEADTSSFIQSVTSTLPGEAGQPIVAAFSDADKPSDATSTTAAVFGIAVALWSASSGMVALQSGLNVAYDVPEDRKLIGKRGIALLLLAAALLLGGVPSPVFTFGESTIFVVLGWILTVGAVMVMFSIFYYVGPNRRSPSWQWVTVGGIVGTFLWIAASLALGFYVENLNNYSKTYGALGGVIVLILWLFITSIAVLIGGELNSELERQAAKRSARAADD